MIKPSIGRVVWYYPSGRSQVAAGDQPRAAVIVHVHGDRMVNLTWFDPNGGQHGATSVQLVQEGDEQPEFAFCTWMPYQLGQKARTEELEKQLSG